MSTLDASATLPVSEHPAPARAPAHVLVRLPFLSSTWPLAGAAAVTAAAFALAWWSLAIDGAFASVAALMVAAAVVFAAAEPRPARIVSLNLFFVAFAARAVVLTSLSWAVAPEGGPFLGPDSTGYLAGATDLASRGFHIGTSPSTFFGTYTVSHFYLFAGAVRYLGADLFALQTLNAGLAALAAPLTFSIARRVLPRGARAAGLLVAVYPSLIVLSVVDLLKDPSQLLATLVAVWALLSIVQARRPARMVAPVGAGFVALVYVYTGRFYTFVYIEAAVVCAAVWMLAQRRGVPVRARSAVVALAVMFVGAEAAAQTAGWPSPPMLFAAQVLNVIHTPAMLPASHHLLGHATGNAGAGFAAALVGRVLGPFPWIAPERWDLRSLEAGDILLYPGVLVWYAMLPLTVFGLAVVPHDAWRGAKVRFAHVFLWLFTCVYLAQYLAINLSYRQREIMFPVLVLFAGLGVVRAGRYEHFSRWYGAYWVGLVLMAAAHLAVRAYMS